MTLTVNLSDIKIAMVAKRHFHTILLLSHHQILKSYSQFVRKSVMLPSLALTIPAQPPRKYHILAFEDLELRHNLLA